MFDSANRRLRTSRLYPYARFFYRRLQKRPRHPLQETRTVSGYRLIRLGTEYGGWTFVDDPYLHGSTIISAGLGEDASFDVEFAKRYNAKVIIVDPTPRAIAHFNEIAARLGIANSCGYVDGGKQPAEAYDLTDLDKAHFTLVPKALWNSETTVKFFEPSNPEHVSHSIVDFQNSFEQTTRYTEVETITVPSLLDAIHLEHVDIGLLKLDIEGAEVEVISHLLNCGIRPRQVLIEFDELTAPSSRGLQRVDSADAQLKSAGYRCIYTDGRSDFLYVPAT